MTNFLASVLVRRRLWLLLLLVAIPLLPQRGEAQENRLQRIRIAPRSGVTRITFFFQRPPEYTLTRVSGRLRLTIGGTSAPPFRRYRGYADPRVAGVFCSQRGENLQIMVGLKEAGEVQAFTSLPDALTLDIGAGVKKGAAVAIAAGREPILSGTEKFVREFGTTVRAGLPFVPTDPKRLHQMLPEQEALLFQRGEGLLYKEQGAEAIQVFSYFLAKDPAVRGLASYRLGEANYLLERYEDAVKAFREGERLVPDYLEQAPAAQEAYADARVRTGDYAGGKALLVRLIARQAGSSYAGPLLNHLAGMQARHGDEVAAINTYRAVLARFPGSSAASRAAMKITDREMFNLTPESYRSLQQRYRAMYDAPGDNALRDEALFKVALLEALYGPPQEALDLVMTYERRYPRGIFATIVKKMRAELLLPVYHQIFAAKDQQQLVKLATENREYLSVCLSDPQFVRRVADACRAGNMLNVEITLFGYLADRSWAGASAPYLLERLVEDAHALGNLNAAEEAGRTYLARFAKHPESQRVREHLGAIAFEKGDLKGAAGHLGFLNGKKVKALLPESDYYLGKALAAGGDRRGGERAFSRFVAGAASGSPLLTDAYFALALARVALSDLRGAVAAYQAGAKLASGEVADQFRYKLGELYLQQKMVREAILVWEKLVKEGSDSTWRKMASERLSDLEWRLKMSKELSASSKK